LQIGIDSLPIRICRSIREHNLDSKQAKARRNIRLADLQIKENSPTTEMLNCLGDAFQTLEDNDHAVQFFRHALQASEHGSADMLEAYYGIITSLDANADHREMQLATCIQALEIFPLDAQLLCAMGGYLQAQGQTELAMQSYQTAHLHGQVNPSVWHVGEVHEIAAICYSLMLQMLGRDAEALQVIDDALTARGNSVRLRRHLIELLIKLGRRDTALQQVNELPGDFPNRDALRSAIRGACLAAANNWIAAKAYLNTAYRAGCRDPICLRWFATTLLAAGEVDDARPIVEQWTQIEPTNATAQQFQAALQNSPSQAPAPPKQVRIDAPDSQQSHLSGSPLHLPSHQASPGRRASGRR